MSRNNNEKYYGWIGAILLFCIMQPYFVWNLPSKLFLLKIPFYILLLIHFDSRKISLTKIGFTLLVLMSCICERQTFFGILTTVPIALLFWCDEAFLKNLYEKTRFIYILIISISIIVYILVQSGVGLPYTIIDPLNKLKEEINIRYRCYPFLLQVDSTLLQYESLSYDVRFHGVFDEPGVVGTISFLFLLVDGFNFKDKKNIVLLISGLLSMSLFFYIAIAIYYFISIMTRREVSSKVKVGTVLLIIILVIVSLRIPVIQALIWDRLQWNNDTQTISGMDRAGAFIRQYVNSIRGTSAYFFGIGDMDYYRANFQGDASIYNAILRYGIIVVALYFIFYFLFIKKYIGINLNTFVILGMMYLTLWQRPAFFEIEYIFLFNMCIYAHKIPYGQLEKVNNNNT